MHSILRRMVSMSLAVGSASWTCHMAMMSMPARLTIALTVVNRYMYQVLVDNAHVHTLPEEALYIVRFHSFYAHHQGHGYDHLMDETDKKMLPWLQAFQKCDLYSKTSVMVCCCIEHLL